jgi:hypothetical protein
VAGLSRFYLLRRASACFEALFTILQDNAREC